VQAKVRNVTGNLLLNIFPRFFPVTPDRPNTSGQIGSGVGDSPALCSGNLAPLLCPRLTPFPPLRCVVAQLGWTPLHEAARMGRSEAAKALLEKGAATDAKDNVR
jgi:hypothetical protein